MMYGYPELATIPFGGKRWYSTPTGKYYPSITSVLGATASPEKQQALTNWQNSLGVAKAQQVTQTAADRGTAVHLMIERHLKNEDVFAPVNGVPFSAADISSFRALKGKLKSIDQVWGQEVSLFSDTLEIAGRCDCIGIFKNKPCIIDFKTSSRVKSDKDIEDYKLQLTAYAVMHNEMFETDINDGVILMVAENGFPLEFSVDLSKYVDKLCLKVEQFHSTVGKPVFN